MLNKNREVSVMVTLALVLLLLLISILSLRFGSAEMSTFEFFSALLSRDGGTASVIIYSIRLPRLLAGIVSGIGLALSGVLLQSVTNNPLASPNVIGVNAGAGFGVVLSLVILPSAFGVASYILLPVFAFVFALLTTFLVLVISNAAGGTRSSVVLAGVAVTALLNAFISAVNLADTDVLASYNAFSVGGFSSVSYLDILIPSVIILICLCVSMLLSSEIELLCLGKEVASSLGVRVARVRIAAIILAAASAAASVSFAGLLGFVGLIVPHIARAAVGSRMSRLLPSSALLGASVTVLADHVGRLIISPSEIPVGIMLAFVGAPFFIALLFGKRGGSGAA